MIRFYLIFILLGFFCFVVSLFVGVCFQVCAVVVIVLVSFCFAFVLFVCLFVCLFVFFLRKKYSFHFNVGGGRVKL